MNDKLNELTKPFEESYIKWRVQNAGVNGSNAYVMVVPYVSSKAIQDRLDDVFGLFGWENEFMPTPDGKGYLCGITIHDGDKSVTKWDGAQFTNIEALKGALSDSTKRAGKQLGVGRYLNDLTSVFAICGVVNSKKEAGGDNVHTHFPEKNNKNNRVLIAWQTPPLPKWALPFEDYSEFLEPIKKSEDLEELKKSFKVAILASRASKSEELEEKAIKEKDKIKSFIEKNIEAINIKKLSEVDKWLDEQIKVYSQLPNKSTIDNFHKLTNEALKVRLEEKGILGKELYLKVEKIHKERLTELKNKEKS